MTSSNLYKNPEYKQCYHFYITHFPYGESEAQVSQVGLQRPSGSLKVVVFPRAFPGQRSRTLIGQDPLQKGNEDKKYEISQETEVRVGAWKCGHPYQVSTDLHSPD